MDLEYGERYEEFRQEVRGFLDAHKPGSDELGREDRVRWLTKQIEHGYWRARFRRSTAAWAFLPWHTPRWS